MGSNPSGRTESKAAGPDRGATISNFKHPAEALRGQPAVKLGLLDASAHQFIGDDRSMVSSGRMVLSGAGVA